MLGWIEVALPLGIGAAALAAVSLVVRKVRRSAPVDLDELGVVDAYNRALFAGLQPGETATFAAVASELGTTPELVRDVIARRWRSH